MALLCCNGFEQGITDFYPTTTSVFGTVSCQASVVRTGTYALRVNPTGNNAAWTGMGTYDPATGLLANYNAYTNLYTCIYFRYATGPVSGDEMIHGIGNGSSGNPSLARLLLTTAGKLKMDFPNAGGPGIATLGPGPTTLSANTWYRLEMHLTFGVSGFAEARVDGVSQFSASGDVNNGKIVSDVWLGRRSNLTTDTVDFFYDDFATDDANWVGPIRVAQLIPTSDGTYAAWTAGTGASNFTQVNVIPASPGTTYIANNGSVSGQTSTFNLTNPTTAGIVGSIKGTSLWCPVRTPAGSPSLAVRTRVSGTDFDLFGTTIPGTRGFGNTYAVSPATGVKWTVSELSSIQVGPKMVNSGTLRCTAVALNVAYNEAGDSVPSLPALGAGQ